MKKLGLGIFIFLWGVGISYVLAHMHGIHKVEFKNKVVSGQNIETKVFTSDFAMVHILTEECGCSQILAEYLIKRGPLKDTKEFIYFIGKTKEYKKDLKSKGFEVTEFSENDTRFEGVPMLVIYKRDIGIVYAGGYSKRIITPITKILDLSILNNLKNDKDIAHSYPIQGCAVSKDMMAKIDPLGLKYETTRQ